MFQFPGFPSLYLFYSVYDNVTLLTLSSLIRTSAALCSFAAPRGFSQLVASFFGAMYQGILLYALCSLIFFELHFCNPSNYLYFFYFPWLYSTNSFVNRSYVIFFRINLSSFSIVYLLFALMYYFFKSFSSIIILLIISLFLCSCQSTVKSLRRFLWALCSKHSSPTLARLVGTSGLEPPTSRLSGVCSNQLSYVPVFCW